MYYFHSGERPAVQCWRKGTDSSSYEYHDLIQFNISPRKDDRRSVPLLSGAVGSTFYWLAWWLIEPLVSLRRDVEQVAYFDLNAQRKSLTYSVKQMLAREIELEKLRQYESNLGPIIPKPIEPIVEPEVMKAPANPAMFKLKPKTISESYKVSPSVEATRQTIWFYFWKEGGQFYRWIDLIIETEVEKSS